MKPVFIVLEICDYEYGCRQIESVWGSMEAAERHVEELGGNQEIVMWTGRSADKYDIEMWEVQF